jgi:hypothetical protein
METHEAVFKEGKKVTERLQATAEHQAIQNDFENLCND